MLTLICYNRDYRVISKYKLEFSKIKVLWNLKLLRAILVIGRNNTQQMTFSLMTLRITTFSLF